MAEMISNAKYEFQRHKCLADRAISQLDDADFFRRPSDDVNPVALIVKHLGANLLSRWSEFLTTDGNKPSRDRDLEFRLAADDTRANLLAAWEHGWQSLFNTLDSLTDPDLDKTVTIGGEVHSVAQAVLRGLTHAAYHTGQIMYLTRYLQPESAWATIAPGQSRNHPAAYLKAQS